MAGSWLSRLTVILVGFTGGMLAFSAEHTSPNRASCNAWKEITTAIVEDAEDLGRNGTGAEATLTSAASELDHDASDYPTRSYHPHTPSVPASDELLQATQRLAAPHARARGIGLLHMAIEDFAEVCR